MCRRIASLKLRHVPSDGRTSWAGLPAGKRCHSVVNSHANKPPTDRSHNDRNAGANAPHGERIPVVQRKEIW